MSLNLLSRALLLLAASALLIWPALYNGQPIFFSDTTAYVRGADAGIARFTGFETDWSQPQEAPSQKNTPGATPPDSSSDGSTPNEVDPYASTSSVEDKSVLAGRSVYYGALLYLGHLAGNFWLSVGIQALLVAAAIAFTLRASTQFTWPRFAAIVAIALLTPAPFFASLLMPDLFAGLTILSCAVLIATGGQRSGPERVFWFLLLSAALLFHTTHVLLATFMLGLGAIAYAIEKPKKPALGLLLIAAALVVSYIGNAAFNYAVTRLVGVPPIQPPFLTARTIDDGPGYRYLRATCPQSNFVVCRFVDRLPLSANDFLWDARRGVFAAVDADTRRALSQEQFRLLFAVVAHDPVGQLVASAHNAWRQAVSVELETFQYYDEFREAWARKLPRDYWETMQRTAAYSDRMPIRLFTWLTGISAAISLGYIAYLLTRNKRQPAEGSNVAVRIAVLVVVGVIANAIFCGVLSGPHDRYQTRVIWLLPVIALTTHFALHKKSAFRTAEMLA